MRAPVTITEAGLQPGGREAQPRLFTGPLLDNDPWLLGGAAALAGLGLVMMTSASITVADRSYDDALYFLWRQLVALGIGLILGLAALTTPLEKLQRASGIFLFLGIALLVVVLAPGVGHQVNGSLRWIELGPATLQASEIAKLCVVIYLAAYLVRHGDQVRERFIGFIKPIGLLTIIAFLLLLEPDYGAAAVLFATCLGMLFMAGVSLLRFFSWGLVAVAALATVAMMKAYRLTRLLTFTDPWSDPYDTGFQLTQALIAFGRGEWFGVGLGASIQKLFYLPEVHTDFVLAVIAEELGFAGTTSVVVLFTFLVWRTFHIGGRVLRSGRPFQAYVAYGVGLLIGLQAFVNMGVNMGVLPTKGLPLPFVSYGANNLAVSCVAVSLVLRAAHEARQPPRVWSRKVPHSG
ncbi:MAG: putative lipid II flippase FtsW [Chromatiales bacterium]